MLAVVVDDHDMGVTHIIRGDDHLTNAFRQLNLYHALNWTMPSMSHIPLIHGPDGAKLSKRHGAVGVDHYRAMGFLPETMINGLLRLGWSHGNEEKITKTQAVSWFDGTALSKSAARFDLDKFMSLNGHYLRYRNPESLWHALVHEPLDAPELPQDHWDKGKAILPALAIRCATLCDLRQQMRPYLSPLLDTPLVLSDGDKEILSQLADFLPLVTSWIAENLEETLRLWAKERDLSFGAVAKPLRLALTGCTISPSLTDVMVALGQEWTLLRIQQAC
jgi:glutamyl-tRNA synthetase